MMNSHDFINALASKNLDGYSEWFEDDIRLYTPIHEKPVIGRDGTCLILPIIYSIFDDIHYPDAIIGQHTHAFFFRAKVNTIPLEGINYVHTNDEGYITKFTVAMRPLKAIATLSKSYALKLQHIQTIQRVCSRTH